MNQSPLLYKLQLTDSDIDQAESRIQAIETIISSDREIAAATEVLSSTRTNAHLASHAVHEAEEVVKEIRIKIATSEQSLYGGKIHNPKELQDLQIEIALLKKRLSGAEDHELEKMMELEEADKALELANSSLSEIKNRKATELALLMGEQDTLRRKLERLHKERAVTVGSISPDILPIYENLRKVKKGKAVSAIVDGSCEGCGSIMRPAEMQAIRSSNQIVNCDSCGRILYSG